MTTPAHWLVLFTGKTWEEFKAAGGDVVGFPERRWIRVARMKPRDHLLCYVTGVSRFIGVAEVVGKTIQDSKRNWDDADFACRIRVKSIVEVSPEHAVPIQSLREKLDIFKGYSRTTWTGRVRTSPTAWSATDGDAVRAALENAQLHPESRPVSESKWKRRPSGPSLIPAWRARPMEELRP